MRKSVIHTWLPAVLAVVHTLALALPGAAADLPAAERFIAGNNWAAAEAELAGLVRAEPEHARALLLLGCCRMQLGRPAAALDSYLAAAALAPTLDAHLGAQWALVALGRWRESLDAGARALAINAGDYWATLRAAYARFQLGDHAGAKADYEKLAAAYPRDAEALWGAALAAYRLGESAAGAGYLARAYQADPGHAGVRRSLGLPAAVPYPALRTWFETSDFSATALKTSSSTWGTEALWAFTDRWSVSGSYAQTTTLRGGGQADYVTGLAGLEGLHRFPAGTSLAFGGQYLSGNDAWSDGAALLYGRFRSAGSVDWSGSAALLAYPRHTGYQVSLGLGLPLFAGLTWQATGYGLLTAFQSTGTGPGGGGGLKFYGAVDQTLSFKLAPFTLGSGLRLGSLYTPLLATGAVFDTETLGTGYYLFADVAVADWLAVHAGWSLDYWSNTQRESPVSSQFHISLNMRLP